MAEKGLIQKQQEQVARKATPTAILNTILDGDSMRKRFSELLGDRAPQFISSIITLTNSSPELQKVCAEDPMSIIAAGLRAATYDLPVDVNLGYAYIIPRRNMVSVDGPNGKQKVKRWQASFQIGYKGLIQLCVRSGMYKILPNGCDVREGELVSYDRLKGTAEFDWILDEDEREKTPIIGYAAYFQMLNGAEKTLYMSKKQIETHEQKYRSGEYMGKGWRDDWNAMAIKTVVGALIRKHGIMSIEYRAGSPVHDLVEAAGEDEYPLAPDEGVPTETETETETEREGVIEVNEDGEVTVNA